MKNVGRTITQGKPIGKGAGFSSVSWWGFFHWLYPRKLPIDRTVGFKSLHGHAVKNIWTSFRQSGSLEPNPAKGQPRIVDETNLDVVHVLKQIAPSMTYKEFNEYIERYSAKSPSISAIGLAVHERIWARNFPFTNLFILFCICIRLKPIDRSMWANIFIAVFTRLECISCENVLFELLIIEHMNWSHELQVRFHVLELFLILYMWFYVAAESCWSTCFIWTVESCVTCP